MRAAWILNVIACTTIVVEHVSGHKPGGDNCCNGNKILDTIQRIVAYGGHKGHQHHHNRHFTAFSARLKNHLTSSQDKQKVIFNDVVTNYGNAYKNGVFTSPTEGLYAFDCTILSLSGKTGHVNIAHNGNILEYIAYAQGGSGIYAAASTSAILHLKKGDQVWMVTSKNRSYHSGYTAFRGWLLQKI